jgi:hypothetical protein
LAGTKLFSRQDRMLQGERRNSYKTRDVVIHFNTKT